MADIHGLVFGGLFLVAFIVALVGIWRFRAGLRATKGVDQGSTWLNVGLGGMAAVVWAIVLSGTWLVYPSYREKLAGATFAKCDGLEAPSSVCSPRDFLHLRAAFFVGMALGMAGAIGTFPNFFQLFAS